MRKLYVVIDAKNEEMEDEFTQKIHDMIINESRRLHENMKVLVEEI